MFCYLFRQKWFDSFPKCSIINYSLSMKIAIKILFSFLEDWQRSYIVYCRLSISLFVFKNLFLKCDLFMISLLNFLFIKGDWLALTYLFFDGACLSWVIFTDSFSDLNGTFCWSYSFDKSYSVSVINEWLQNFLDLR